MKYPTPPINATAPIVMPTIIPADDPDDFDGGDGDGGGDGGTEAEFFINATLVNFVDL